MTSLPSFSIVAKFDERTRLMMSLRCQLQKLVARRLIAGYRGHTRLYLWLQRA